MPITLQGGRFQTIQGLPVAYGSLELKLARPAQIVASPYGNVMARIPIIIALDANGNISGSPQIWSGAELNPSGIPYFVSVYDRDGALLNEKHWCWVFDQVDGSTVDVSDYPNSCPCAGVELVFPYGPTGYTGYTGPSAVGYTGYTGYTGPSGYATATGSTGYTGPASSGFGIITTSTSPRAAPTIVQSANGGSLTSPATVTLVSTPTVGNTLLAVGMFTCTVPVDVSLPAGFTSLGKYSNASYGGGVVIGYRAVQAGDGKSWDFIVSGWSYPYYGGNWEYLIEITGIPTVMGVTGGGGTESGGTHTVQTTMLSAGVPVLVIPGFSWYYICSLVAESWSPTDFNAPIQSFAAGPNNALLAAAFSSLAPEVISVSLSSSIPNPSEVAFAYIVAGYPVS